MRKKNFKNHQKPCNTIRLKSLINATAQIRELKSELKHYKKLCGEFFTDSVLAQRKIKMEIERTAFYADLVEHLKWHVISKKSIEEIEQAKKDYKDFESRRLEAKIKCLNEMRTCEMMVNGKYVKKEVLKPVISLPV